MAPQTETDNDANEWFNGFIPKLRFKQDYDIYPGEAEPIMKDGKQTGIRIKREHVKLFSTGVTKLYQLIVLKETWPDVKYTPEEEEKFDREFNEKYGQPEPQQ